MSKTFPGRKRDICTYMHINVHTLTHIYMRGGGDEREHIQHTTLGFLVQKKRKEENAMYKIR
jgi:hypothetical protein